MLTKDAIAHFGTKAKLAVAAGVEAPTVYRWREFVPEGRAARLEKASNGALKYDAEIYKNLNHGNKHKQNTEAK